MMKHTLIFVIVIAAMLSSILQGCGGGAGDNTPAGNAVYYWRTSFELSDAEKAFITDNEIRTLYVKFFDVVADGGILRPEATLLFNDSFPNGTEIVPVVFIDSRALGAAPPANRLASMILARVDSMMTKNGYLMPAEVQIDFDWTEKNRNQYFALLAELSTLLHDSNRRLSTTIRLHQLSQPAPPVDYGALMVYNIGNFADASEPNSILSIANLKPYLRYLGGYELPLVTALPIYSWDLLFRDGRFMAIARGINRHDTTQFMPTGANHYIARRYMPLPSASSGDAPGARILPGDILRHEVANATLLDSVVDAIGNTRPEALRRVILYHLDEKTISNYTNHELKKIYGNN